MLRFMLPTCQGDRSRGTPDRNADGEGDEHSEGGHQELRLRASRSASQPINSAATQAPMATPTPTPSAVPTPNIIQIMVPPTRASGSDQRGHEDDDRGADQVQKSDGFWIASIPV
jgi:hypothetical protein